ncbi:rod shape-determining protein MreD [Alteromonas sp. a30]|uniref:rod shape-determining protein MreD n=1 Tax=Alteromonas sp. a30 TaxID=2730917 RepID=UPI00228283AD|nr:rod shape-determining protein MreD [Alteromonas sp. a30]MCY7295259.1 rod shape-determining protein MreD [Alteromonas sp. a30]
MFQIRHYIIGISLVLALMFQIMPMPPVVDPFRPDWVYLVIAYWTLALPNRVNVGVAFINGLLLDVLLGTTLGVHSLALCAVTYILAANYLRLRNYSVWQQAIIIGLLSALYHLIVFWLLRLLTDLNFNFEFLWPVITGMVFWPWIFLLLRKMRRQFRVS